jgi:hypothetical protein
MPKNLSYRILIMGRIAALSAVERFDSRPGNLSMSGSRIGTEMGTVGSEAPPLNSQRRNY